MKNLFLLALLATTAAAAAPILYTIGADSNGIPRNLVSFDVATGTQQSSISLGNGDFAYFGGLIFNGTNFIGVKSDSSANVDLVSITLAGAVTTLQSPLAQGSFGGLYNSGGTVTHLLSNDPQFPNLITFDTACPCFGNSLASLPSGQYGGLTYTPSDGLFYTIGNDSFGTSTLYSINTATNAAIAQSITLGSGFTGGIVYTNNLFYAIASDFTGLSKLYSFQLTDSAPTALFDLGYGYNAASLTVGPTPTGNPGGNPTGVPEPSALLLSASALAILVWKARHARA